MNYFLRFACGDQQRGYGLLGDRPIADLSTFNHYKNAFENNVRQSIWIELSNQMMPHCNFIADDYVKFHVEQGEFESVIHVYAPSFCYRFLTHEQWDNTKGKEKMIKEMNFERIKEMNIHIDKREEN